MILLTRVLALALILSGAPSQLLAQQKPAGDEAAKQTAPIRLGANEVVVNAVVTDKKSRPVSDLTADDFELYEDGVKQKIVSFRFESAGRAAEIQSQAPSKAIQPEPGRLVNLVSMVFDAQTTREGALLGRRTALEYIQSGMGPDDYVAVFGFDTNLMVLAPFTQDKDALRRAVEAFTSRESKRYNSVAEDVQRSLEGLVTPLSDAEKIAFSDTMIDADAFVPLAIADPGSKGNPYAIDPAQVMLVTIKLSALQVLRTFQVYERQFQAFKSVDALLAIINGQRTVRAGRKSLFLFSEGFPVPADLSSQFLSVISAANKAGITIYALDIAGLRLTNPNDLAMLERDAAAAKRIRNSNPDLVQAGASALGRMEDTARLNSVTNLDELSEETGGFTVKNTNDLTEGLRRILEGLSNYYVMTYVPANQNYDGKFRRITLKLKRAGDFQLRARQGYFGLRTLDGSPVMAQELPLLDKLSGNASQRDFPFYAQALNFRGTNTARRVAVFTEFPMSALQFTADEKSKTFSTRFAVLALVKNGAGDVVRKVGQEFTLRGPISQLAQTKEKPQIYSRFILLEPGKYTLEAVVRDSATGKASVSRTPFEVPQSDESGLRMSSIVLSRGVNPLSEDQKKQAGHPLYLEGQAYFVPNVSQAFRRSSDKNLLVYFNVYPARDKAETVSVTVEFLKSGALQAQSMGFLPAPDAAGRILYTTSFGIEKFPPGEYELRITAGQGLNRAASSAYFTVVE